MFLGKTFVHGIYALCYLSRMPADELVSASVLAARVGVPAEHARKIMIALADAGLVKSSRGRSGGYSLARAPKTISMLEVLEALKPAAAEERIQRRKCQLSSSQDCCVYPGLELLHQDIKHLLAERNLFSVIGSECSMPPKAAYGQ